MSISSREEEILDLLRLVRSTQMASQQTLTDLENAVNANTAAVAVVIAALNAATDDDATIESQVTNLNAATAQLTAAAPEPAPSSTPTPTPTAD